MLIDQFLSGRSAQGGLLVEWLSSGDGAGDSTIAFLTARDEQRHGRLVIVIDPLSEFYPPAAEALGLKVANLVVVEPRSQAEALWAWEESLRTADATVIGPLERASGMGFRRLKLAVETGSGLGLLLRPLRFRSERSWADLRLVVSPVCSAPFWPALSRRLQVEALYVRGRLDRRRVIVDISDETASLSLAPQLADPASARRRACAS